MARTIQGVAERKTVVELTQRELYCLRAVLCANTLRPVDSSELTLLIELIEKLDEAAANV